VADDMIFISMIAVDVDGSENEILSTSCVLPSAFCLLRQCWIVCWYRWYRSTMMLFSASLPDGLFGALVLEDATSLLFPPK